MMEWVPALRWRELLSRARTLELSVGFADPFYDIDVADDLNSLGGGVAFGAGERRHALRSGLRSGSLRLGRLKTGQRRPVNPPRRKSVHTGRHVVRGVNDLLLQLQRPRWAVLHGLYHGCGHRVPVGCPRVFWLGARTPNIFPARRHHRSRPDCSVEHCISSMALVVVDKGMEPRTRNSTGIRASRKAISYNCVGCR